MIITNFHESIPLVGQVICQNESVEWHLPGAGGSRGNGEKLDESYKFLATKWLISGDLMHIRMTLINAVLYTWKLLSE